VISPFRAAADRTVAIEHLFEETDRLSVGGIDEELCGILGDAA
jgi:hypothetical protein